MHKKKIVIVMVVVMLLMTVFQGKSVYASELENFENGDFVDIAYQNMTIRENYVANLISSHSGIETTMSA